MVWEGDSAWLVESVTLNLVLGETPEMFCDFHLLMCSF